jgi:hypothetical protein
MTFEDDWRTHCILCANARPVPPPGLERLRFTLTAIQAHYASPDVRTLAIKWYCPDGLVRKVPAEVQR